MSDQDTCLDCGRPRWETLGERRQLTVLFCDLVDSTNLAVALDPEDYAGLLHVYQALCEEVVERYGGQVAQYLGDGIMAYFGWQVANEDDAVRAVRAGLGIVDVVQRAVARGELRHPLAVRVGVHTGLVVANARPVDSDRPGAFGDTPNIAARLQAAAQPNSVTVSASTHQLADGFVSFESLGEHLLRGVPSKLALYRAIASNPVSSRFDLVVSRGPVDFQARRAELAVLAQRMTTALSGQGQAILVSGEAGIGKSRLVHEFRGHAIGDRRILFVAARCDPYRQSMPLTAVSAALKQLSILGESSAEFVQYEDLSRWLTRLGLDSGETLRLVAPALAVELPADLMVPPSGKPDELLDRMLRALVEIVLRSARQSALGFWIEDLHWADHSTRRFVSLLAERSHEAPLLLLATTRPGCEVTPESGWTELRLGPLSPADSKQIVRALSASGALPDDLLQQIVQRADGVPLFIEELTKAVLESVPAPGGTRTAAGEAWLPIPATLQDSLMARLDRLFPGKAVAQVAAVIGREASLAVLREVSPFGERELILGLDQLRQAGLVNLSDDADPLCVFKHVLVQQAAYGSLLNAEKRRYHSRIARALLDKFVESANASPDIVAHHASKAQDWRLAADSWLQAAQAASGRNASDETLGALEHAHGNLRELEQGPERWQLELRVQMLTAHVVTRQAGYSATPVEQAYQRAQELCEALDEAGEHVPSTHLLSTRLRCAEELRKGTPSPSAHDGDRLFWVRWGFGAYYQARAELSKSLEIGRQLLVMAGDDKALQKEAYFGIGSTEYYLGRFAAAEKSLESAWSCHQTLTRQSRPSPSGHHVEVHSLAYLALALWHLGEHERAAERAATAIELARSTEHAYTLASALSMGAWLAQMMDDVGLARARAEEADALCELRGFSFLAAWARPVLHWVAMQGGSLSEAALLDFQARLERYREAGHRVALTYFGYLLVQCLLHAGRNREAAEALATALSDAKRSEEHFWTAELLRIEAESVPGAAARLGSAAALAERQGSLALLNRARGTVERTRVEPGLVQADYR